MTDIPQDVRKLTDEIISRLVEIGEIRDPGSISKRRGVTRAIVARAIMADRASRQQDKGAEGWYKPETPPAKSGPYLCWCDTPPQSMSVQALRYDKERQRWLTSWPIVAWREYPAPPDQGGEK